MGNFKGGIIGLAALIGLPLTSGPAEAGEVPWTYTTTISTANDSLMMSLGSLALPDPATGTTAWHYYYAPLSHPNPTGEFDGPARWRVAGFALTDVSDLPAPLPGGNYDNDMYITLTVRDETSGQIGHITTYSFVGASFDHNAGKLYPYIGANLDPHPLVLGDSRYLVNFRYEQDGREAWFVTEVTVRPASETPEPGTLALAGIGLGVVGLRLRRRSAM